MDDNLHMPVKERTYRFVERTKTHYTIFRTPTKMFSGVFRSVMSHMKAFGVLATLTPPRNRPL